MSEMYALILFVLGTFLGIYIVVGEELFTWENFFLVLTSWFFAFWIMLLEGSFELYLPVIFAITIAVGGAYYSYKNKLMPKISKEQLLFYNLLFWYLFVRFFKQDYVVSAFSLVFVALIGYSFLNGIDVVVTVVKMILKDIGIKLKIEKRDKKALPTQIIGSVSCFSFSVVSIFLLFVFKSFGLAPMFLILSSISFVYIFRSKRVDKYIKFILYVWYMFILFTIMFVNVSLWEVLDDLFMQYRFDKPLYLYFFAGMLLINLVTALLYLGGVFFFSTFDIKKQIQSAGKYFSRKKPNRMGLILIGVVGGGVLLLNLIFEIINDFILINIMVVFMPYILKLNSKISNKI